MIRRLIAVGAALLAAAAAPASAQTVGVNAAVVNNVTMTTQANPKRHRAVVKTMLRPSGAQETAPSSPSASDSGRTPPASSYR